MPTATALSTRAARASEAQAAAAAARRGWNQASELPSPNPSYDSAFGYSVAVSGDTMVVGSQGANNDNGAAYVFTGSGSSWTYATTLSPAGVTLNDCLSTSNVCEEFGASVAITSGTIVVGAFGAGANDGAAFVYAGSGSSWTQQAVISDPGQTANDDFGIAVAISSSSTIMVGAFGENSYDGAVYVYNKGGSGWPTSPSDTLTAPGPEGAPGYGELFGLSLAVSSTTMVIGAPGDPGATSPVPANCNATASAGCATGAAYVYKEVRGDWIEQAKLTASNGEGCDMTCSDGADSMGGDYFGWSVAIQGKRVAVGAPWATAPSPPSSTGPEPDGSYTSYAPDCTGTVYAFTGSGASWAQKDELYDPAEVTNGGSDWFGYNVALLGKSIVATAPYDGPNAAGSAYVFLGESGTWATYPTQLTASNGAGNVNFGYGSPALATIGSKYVAVGAPYFSGEQAVYIFHD
ncbi:MAG: hypothetical protein WBG41_05735 [Acidimicrobiales bacterium]